MDSFRKVYAINGNYSAGEGVAVGRYAEDVYYNGNVSRVFFSRIGVDVWLAVVPRYVRSR